MIGPGHRLFCSLILFCCTLPLYEGRSQALGETTLFRGTQLVADTLWRNPAAAHYDVIALRVEFQPDTTVYTTGPGVFEGALFDTLTHRVDPLPHNADYFQAHLAFLEDYVRNVSDGKTTVSTHLIPDVIRVSQPMAAYSPTGPDSESEAERRKLAALVEEAWRLADERIDFDMSNFDPERTAFVLFHAGVGRDIELTGTTLDRTPQDLPSIFLDTAAFDRLISEGRISFKGMEIDHMILLPRTEIRQGFNYITQQPFLIELSINGMMAASFFNYLGVPDLFDTETGTSVIGPFGLMDPLGIFAYSGLFPPEPSAWTRYYLGWTQPLDVRSSGPDEITLYAASTDRSPDVARIPISDTEYFLVENRNRDPEGDGLVLRVWKDGAIVEQHVENGDESFNGITREGFIGGVVVGVDNYDWALPGGLDDVGNILNGGMLVWHVDMYDFDEKKRTNSLNAGTLSRTVDLEEADGAQDIGIPSNNPFGPQLDIGSPFDFFYEGNPVVVETITGSEIRLYQNRFGPDTYPNSNSNKGGPSFISLESFSKPGSQMSFTFTRQATLQGISRLLEYLDVTLSGNFSQLSGLDAAVDGSFLYASTGVADMSNSVQASHSYVIERETGEVVQDIAAAEFAHPVVLQRGETFFLTSTDSLLSLWSKVDDGYRVQFNRVLESGYRLIPPVVAVSQTDVDEIYVRARCVTSECSQQPESSIFGIRISNLGISTADIDFSDPVLSIASDGQHLIVVGETRTEVLGTDFFWEYPSFSGEQMQAVFGRDRANDFVGFLPGSTQSVFLLGDGTVQVVESAFDDLPVLADLDNDSLLDALGTRDGWLVAYTQGGALVSNFPIQTEGISSQPLVARLTESGRWSVIVASTDGYVHAYDMGRQGREVPGFPLPVGTIHSTPLLQDNRLYAVTQEGSLYGWNLGNVEEIWWGQLFGNGQHQSFAELETTPGPVDSQAGLIVGTETYNWPNPIRSGETNLRCQVTRDARVRIRIVDMAGSQIDELTIENVRAGVPVEHLWRTNAPSGLYFARVTATADDGQSESLLIKMAVIR